MLYSQLAFVIAAPFLRPHITVNDVVFLMLELLLCLVVELDLINIIIRANKLKIIMESPLRLV